MSSSPSIDAAFALLDTIREELLCDRPHYRQPHIVLTALLTHAPTYSGKENIAKDILAETDDDERLSYLTRLTDYYFTNLLIACIHPTSIVTNDLVRSQGRRTPAPSDHPSRPGETLDYRTVLGRLNQHEKVAPTPSYSNSGSSTMWIQMSCYWTV